MRRYITFQRSKLEKNVFHLLKKPRKTSKSQLVVLSVNIANRVMYTHILLLNTTSYAFKEKEVYIC